MRPTGLRFLFSVLILGASESSLISEKLTFTFRPSFTPGTAIELRPLKDGQIECLVKTIPVEMGASEKGRSAVVTKTLVISAADFGALIKEMESIGLQKEAEKTQPGPDGTSWIFRYVAGGRVIELHFLNSETGDQTPLSYALGTKFMLLAKLDGILPKSDPIASLVPVVVPDVSFILPAHLEHLRDEAKR